MSNIIIECRNKESDSVRANGDWSTVLPENVLISEGDQILIKDSYIDTQQTSSSRILIPKDINVSLEYGFYLVMVDNSQLTNWSGAASTSPAANFKNLVLTIQLDGLTDVKIIQNYVLTTLDKLSDSVEGNITFYWKNEIGEDIERRLTIPVIKANEFKQIDVLGGVITDLDLIRTKELLESLGLKLQVQNAIDPTAKSILQPYTETITVELLAGNYTAEQINETLNREINANVANSSDFPTVDEKLLQTARQIQSKYHTGGNNTRQFALCIADDATSDPLRLNMMWNYVPIAGNDIFLGASIFEMDYTDSSKQFEIKYMHTPFYNTEQISIGIYEIEVLNRYIYTTVNKLSGSYFTRMYATEKDTNEPFDFWEGLLGLDVNSIQTYFEFENHTTTIGGNDILAPITTNLVDSVGITGGNSSIDAVVAKSGSLALPTSFPYYASSDPSTTQSILGSASNALDAQNAFGYYLIEIKSSFKNDFLTEDNNWRGISQIVNRYYELNSYTAAEGGQIVYTHKGEDMLLQSLNCRILTSEKELAPNIGNDNTIHLQVVKGQRS